MFMKQNKILIILAFLCLLASCKSDDYADGTPLSNAVYIDAAEIVPETRVTFKKTVSELDREFRAVFTSPVHAATTVQFAVDAAAVERFNRREGTSYKLLDKAHYEFSTLNSEVEAGKNESQPVTIHFKELEALEIDETALLPVSIVGNTAGVGVLDGSQTVYYLVRRSSAITTAANLADCYMWIPSYETAEGRAALNGLSALTYEALVNVHDFAGDAGISTVMGAEQHCLVRFGDTGFPRQQLQTQCGGGKFPEADKSKELQAGEWYHVAMTWDLDGEDLLLRQRPVAERGHDALRQRDHRPCTGRERRLPLPDRLLLQHGAHPQWPDLPSEGLGRGTHPAGDLPRYVRRGRARIQTRAAGMVEVRRGTGQHRQGLVHVPQ